MASKITPQSGLLEVAGRLKVQDAIYANEVLTKGAVGKTLERQVYAAEAIDTTSGTIPIVIAINTADAYDSTSDSAKVKIFDDANADKILGVVDTTIQADATGFAITYGPVTSNINTSSSAVNTPVYADPANGQLTLTNTGKQVGTVLTTEVNGKVLINVAGEAGTGSGGGGVNFVSDPSPESGQASNFITYDDGASTTPTNGTGGTPSAITFATFTSAPVLRSLGDWKISKSAADGQGEGVSYAFSIEPAFKNQILEGEFYYNTSSNYASNDIGMYIYDVTNSIIIYPNVINIPQTNNTNSKFFFKFFVTSGVDYRIIFHVQSTNATAYSLSFTDFAVRPETKVIGEAIGALPDYLTTSSFTGFGTVSAISQKHYRLGEYWIFEFVFTAGTTTATEARIALPPGLSSSSGYTTLQVAGDLTSSNSDRTYYVLIEQNKTYLTCGMAGGPSSSVSALNKQNANAIISAGSAVSIKGLIRIEGWSSNVSLIQSQTEFSYNTDTATGADDTTSFGYGPSGTAFVSISSAGAVVKKRVRFKQPIQITDKIEIEVNNGNGWQSLPYADTTSTIIENFNLYDGAAAEYYGLGYKIINSTDVDVVFGGNGRAVSNSGLTWAGVTSFKWRVRKSAGSAVGEVAPFVGAKYKTTVSANSSTTLPVQWSTKDYDTHNAVTTGSAWKFTCPVAGYYSVKINGQTTASGQNMIVYKNGTSDTHICISSPTGVLNGSIDIKLEQGDYIDVRNTTGTDAIVVISTAMIAISKIG